MYLSIIYYIYVIFSLFFTLNSFAENKCEHSIEDIKHNKNFPSYRQKKNQTPENGGAQFALGLKILYDESKQFEIENRTKAVSYEKVAEQGNPNAQFALGLMYFYVDGVFPRDDKKAVYWLEKSAKQGHQNAVLDLVLLYYKGAEFVRNYVQAYKWLSLYKLTNEKSDPNLDELFNDLESRMTKDQIATAQKLINQFKTQKTDQSMTSI